MLRPLLSGQGRVDGRASHDVRVYRDQLKTVERDLARGVFTDEEAGAVRIEISRRLLAAADAGASETEYKPSPRGYSRLAMLGGGGLAVALALGVYSMLGAPGLSDQPLALRHQQRAAAHAARPGQVEAEALAAERMAEAGIRPRPLSSQDQGLLDRLKEVLEQRPDDADGYRLLAGSLGSVGRFAEARAAQERVNEILGDAVTARDLVNLAELRILATSGYVSPEAEAALVAALELDPSNPLGRYYSGLLMAQAGEVEIAYSLWSGLLAEGPEDAPWIAPIRSDIDEIARLAGRAAPAGPVVGIAGLPGPDGDAMEAAGSMLPEDRAAMIEGMVSQLSERLYAEGGTPEEWVRLIRSLAVLGRMDDAANALDAARLANVDDPQVLAGFEQIAAAVGLSQASGPDLRGPTPDEIAAAAELAPGDRNAMVEGMVARLGDRLAQEGGTAEDWARMITSLGVLKREEQARAVLGEARVDFANDPQGLALILDAGRQAGLIE